MGPSSTGQAHSLVMCDDITSEVHRRLVLFMHYLRWHPRDVWDLTLIEFCLAADYLDDQQEQRRETNRRA